VRDARKRSTRLPARHACESEIGPSPTAPGQTAGSAILRGVHEVAQRIGTLQPDPTAGLDIGAVGDACIVPARPADHLHLAHADPKAQRDGRTTFATTAIRAGEYGLMPPPQTGQSRRLHQQHGCQRGLQKAGVRAVRASAARAKRSASMAPSRNAAWIGTGEAFGKGDRSTISSMRARTFPTTAPRMDSTPGSR